MLIIDEMGAGVGDEPLVGEAAEQHLVLGVEEGDEVALDGEELALAEPALAGVGGPGRGRNRGLGGLALVAHLVVGLFVVGVDCLAERHFLFFVVAFVVALSLDMSGRLSFGSFGFWRSVRLLWRALLRVGQRRR